MRFGLEVLSSSKQLQDQHLRGKIGLVCHPASVDLRLNHALDLFAKEFKVDLTCAFGPQHGVLGEKQDNMVESDDMVHPTYKIPIYSLYGEHRRPQKGPVLHL